MERVDGPATGKRHRYTAKDKLKVVMYARSHSVRAAMTRFSVGRTSIHEWGKQTDQLVKSPQLSMRCVSGIDSAEQPAIISPRGLDSPCRRSLEMRAAATTTSEGTSASVTLQDTNGIVPHGLIESQPNLVPQSHPNSSSPVNERSSTSVEHDKQPQEQQSDFLLIGYHGAKGGFACTAVDSAFSSLLEQGTLQVAAFEVTGFPHISSMFESLHKCEIDYAFIETTVLLSTTHHRTIDRFTALRLTIVGEVNHKEDVCVCAKPGTELSDADCIMSHWTLLQRYDEYILGLESQFSTHIYRQVAWDSVTACHMIQTEEADKTLVLCSKEAGLAHGLVVLQEHVIGATTHRR